MISEETQVSLNISEFCRRKFSLSCQSLHADNLFQPFHQVNWDFQIFINVKGLKNKVLGFNVTNLRTIKTV